MQTLETMTVRVIDRAAEAKAWGNNGFAGPVIKTVEISTACPTCGERRGKPFNHNFHEDGGWYSVDRWNNPCGHVDMYSAVLEEAK